MIQNNRNISEIAVALGIFAFGAFVMERGTHYGLGNLARIGPGLFPVIVGAGIMLLGVALALTPVVVKPGRLSLNWRAIVLVLLAIIAFSIVAGFAGLLPASAATVVLSTLAEPGVRLRTAIVLGVVLPLLAYLAFSVGLGIPIEAFGAWN